MSSETTNRWNRADQWTEELGVLAGILAKTGLTETVKWGAPVYTYKNRNVVGIGGFKDYFTIWFYNGVFLKDEHQKLVNANEGVTKSLRQWRFASGTEVDEKLILQYIREAMEVEDKGLVIKPSKKEFAIPDVLQAALDADTVFQTAFEAFTQGKKNEFLEYIGSAKQEKTQVARLEKIKPMVLAGIGLNDKYRK